MSSEVKRYEIYGPDWDSEENPFGFWVMYSDYAAIEAECDALRQQRDKLAELLDRAVTEVGKTITPELRELIDEARALGNNRDE